MKIDIKLSWLAALSAFMAFLKLIGVLNISWWWVLAPLWVPAAAVALIIIVVVVYVVICDLIERIKHEH